MPRVSVVIPAYNAENHLRQTVESALAQRGSDLEVVIVNDGSTDTTAKVAESFGDPARVIHQTNAGMSAARNRGIDSGDSEFIALLDSDDVWHHDKLALQVQALDAHPEAAFCFTAFVWWWGDERVAWADEPRTGSIDPALSGWIYHQLILDNWALPSSLVFRRSAWTTMGPFLCNDQKTDDWEYIVRASRHFQYLRLQEPFVLYRQLPASLSRRVPAINVGEHMRESLISRFGLQSPDGTAVDARALAQQRYKGWRNFADAHCARGDLRLGLQTFGHLMMRGPNRMHSALSVAKALRRRVFPKV